MDLLQHANYALPSFGSCMTKAGVNELALNAVDAAIEEGNVLQVAESLSAMETFVDLCRKNDRFIDAVVTEVGKYGKTATVGQGSKLEVCETGVKYDYSHNSDWNALSAQEKAIAEKRKALEERLKKIPAGKMLVDEDTGEALVGPAKSSKTNYKLTLAK